LPPTIIDVLEALFGDDDMSPERVGKMKRADVEALAAAVNEHYVGWASDEPTRLRAHLGGWVAGNFGDSDARGVLATALLYADQVLLHDPLAEWFFLDRRRIRGPPPIRYRNGAKLQGSEGHLLATDGWIAHRDDLERNLRELRWMIPALAEMAPVIRSATAVLVPHLHVVVAAQEGLLSAVRHDLRDDQFIAAIESPIDQQPVATDFSRGVRLELSGAGGMVSDADRRLSFAGNPAYYLNKTLAVASAAHALYMPPSATDWAIYEARVAAAARELKRVNDLDLKVLAALHSSRLPLFEGIELATVSRAREDDDAFGEWRAALRRAARGLQHLPVEGAAFEADSRQLLEDELAPAQKAVEKDATYFRRLRQASPDASVRLVAGAAGAGVAAAAVGGPPIGLLTAGVSAAASWALGALLPRKRSGVAEIVAHLQRAR
jgi:hypothetical protein